MRNKLTLLFICLTVNLTFLIAQTTSVSGVVISAEDNEPVIGATVMVKGTSIGTITDYDGKFTINNVPSSARTLQNF